MADSLIEGVETFRTQASLEEALEAGLRNSLSAIAEGEGLKVKLAQGAGQVVRVKRFTRIANRVHAPKRFTARVRGDVLYVERIA